MDLLDPVNVVIVDCSFDYNYRALCREIEPDKYHITLMVFNVDEVSRSRRFIAFCSFTYDDSTIALQTIVDIMVAKIRPVYAPPAPDLESNIH